MAMWYIFPSVFVGYLKIACPLLASPTLRLPSSIGFMILSASLNESSLAAMFDFHSTKLLLENPG